MAHIVQMGVIVSIHTVIAKKLSYWRSGALARPELIITFVQKAWWPKFCGTQVSWQEESGTSGFMTGGKWH